MNIIRRFSLGLSALLCLLYTSHALHAAPTCKINSITSLSFGPVDPIGGMVDVSANLNYECTYSGLLTGGAVSLCFNIGTGTGGTSTSWAPRTMKTGTETMNFQIYTDASRTQIWGSTAAPGIPPVRDSMQFPVGLVIPTTTQRTLSLYGRVPSGQTALAVGAYTSTFSGGDAQMTYAAVDAVLSVPPPPASCIGSGSGTFNFTASANVVPKCQIGTASDMNFGSAPSNFAGNLDQSSAITMTCTRGTAWQIGLNNGQNPSGTTRRMLGGGQYLNYELYRDSARLLRWGNTLNSDTLSAIGTGLSQSLGVYGRVVPQTPRPAGSYSDKITVTVTF